MKNFTNNCYICETEKHNCNDLLCLDCDKQETENEKIRDIQINKDLKK